MLKMNLQICNSSDKKNEKKRKSQIYKENLKKIEEEFIQRSNAVLKKRSRLSKAKYHHESINLNQRIFMFYPVKKKIINCLIFAMLSNCLSAIKQFKRDTKSKKLFWLANHVINKSKMRTRTKMNQNFPTLFKSSLNEISTDLNSQPNCSQLISHSDFKDAFIDCRLVLISSHFEYKYHFDRKNLIHGFLEEFESLKRLEINEFLFHNSSKNLTNSVTAEQLHSILNNRDNSNNNGTLIAQPLTNLKKLSNTILNQIGERFLKSLGDKYTNFEPTCEIENDNKFNLHVDFPKLRKFALFVPRDFRKMKLYEIRGNKLIISSFQNELMEELNLRILNFCYFSSFLANKNKLYNLTRLNLLKCPNSLDDAKLECVCRNLTKLRQFEFSDCPSVTDYGITGKFRNERDAISEFSIQNLKGLVVLKMINCPNISEFSVEFGIKFSHLKYVDLSSYGNHGGLLTRDCVSFIIENNKTIYKIYISQFLKN